MPRARSSKFIDEHVGARVRARRKMLGMNQSALAEKLNVTFQMVQRYEYGLCRISASTLHLIATVMDVPITYFYDGLPSPSGKSIAPTSAVAMSMELAKTRHGRTIALCFPRISGRGAQRAIAELIQTMANDDS